MKLVDYMILEAEESSNKEKKKKKAAPSGKKIEKGSAQVSILIHGRASTEMKAFKNAREKDPSQVAGQFGVKGGPGWDGIMNAINSIASSQGLGAVIGGGKLVDNSKNIESDGKKKPMVGCHVMTTGMWAKGHENVQVSKKLVAWWVKQILRGAFESGLIAAPGNKDPTLQKYAKTGFKKWDQRWKIYESSEGGILVFYGRQKDWNGGHDDTEM